MRLMTWRALSISPYRGHRLELDAVLGLLHAVAHVADQGLQLGQQPRLVRRQLWQRRALEAGAYTRPLFGST